MTSRIFDRFIPSPRGTQSFYEQLRARDDSEDEENDIEQGAGLDVDEENLRHRLDDFHTDDVGVDGSRVTVASTAHGNALGTDLADAPMNPKWKSREDDIDNDVPASLLVEHTEPGRPTPLRDLDRPQHIGNNPGQGQRPRTRARAPAWPTQPTPARLAGRGRSGNGRPKSLLVGKTTGGPREEALWRWANTTNLDTFMRDVYDYFEGGGFWGILCSNGLWLLETLFVAVLLTFLTQCLDYGKLPHSKSLDQVMVQQCTRHMSGSWSLAIWLYSFFFIWKIVQYFLEIRRLRHIRRFYIYLLEIPEQDMQTVSWQDIVARVMTLRDENPKTAVNMPQALRRFIGSQSKERLDAHDIANRLMRKENYLIALINKDVLDLSLPLPFLRGRQMFSKTMEWNLQFCVLDMAFNDLGQVQQDFLRADRRGILSQKLRQRFLFAGCLNLLFAPMVLAYVIIVYFFTYYNEYQKDPKLAAARKYSRLAEWKFREFNELPHIFYERLNMSIPFATRYVDQFPKRMTEDIAKTVAFISGALTAVLAVLTVFDSELFLGFEITKDRTVLFYLGTFGAIWAMTRGMITEETNVFNPEYAMRNVAEYTHYMPEHWKSRLHSYEVKQEFAQLYKMKFVIFLEEVMGIVTTSLLLLYTLPKCSDQIVDFFREFTVHVDGLGYVCSFAVFDFKKGVDTGNRARDQDVREDYYSTKHGKMAASYFGFIDNYVINPKTGIPGHIPPGGRQQFHPPPAFPGLNSPTLATDAHDAHMHRSDVGRRRSRNPEGAVTRMAPPLASPMASMLLDPHHQPQGVIGGGRSLHRSRHPWMAAREESQIIEEDSQGMDESRAMGTDHEAFGGADDLGVSAWQTSPGRGLSRDNSAANADEPAAGVIGMIKELRHTQRGRRGAGVV
ncbi:autophagy protein Apg9-domain-containing protein [Emericellopsis atlantica]|uniref:Autophagy-related protein 9 n=1 Tax=Emericellopsis atlantica TaxID=2614577 RepID=A0A9P8CKP0_9HYPO|nr:autophagy protein Apg9-domain-containing protein [Emericellopsis atlantica]KAG9250140.1 autophagy protein Apg9-domain-containing protein [Emericellopsis atlantica]